MLGQWKKLDVGEAHLLDVVRKFRCDLAIAHRPVTVFRDAAPGTQMHFVNRHRRVERIAPAALGHPFLVVPLVIEIQTIEAVCGGVSA